MILLHAVYQHPSHTVNDLEIFKTVQGNQYFFFFALRSSRFFFFLSVFHPNSLGNLNVEVSIPVQTVISHLYKVVVGGGAGGFKTKN